MARWMAALFAAGSLCFLLGPFPGYVDLVGPGAAAATFFVGSLCFTAGAALQAWVERGAAALVQLAGTLFFNVTTFRALDTQLSNPDYDALVWRPDAFGSVCFLVSGVLAFRADRHRWAGVNLLGCVFFGVAAVAGYVVPASGSTLDLAAANWNTVAGAVCFGACAVHAFRMASPHASSAIPLIDK
ncbi:YrhK family protein [Solirubrobacter taibaiensis]|nr:YrhK family protein [Solirubrobacter taibaiensis]